MTFVFSSAEFFELWEQEPVDFQFDFPNNEFIIEKIPDGLGQGHICSVELGQGIQLSILDYEY